MHYPWLKTNFQFIASVGISMLLPELSPWTEAHTIIAYHDFSPDWSFGDHANQFTNELVPVVSTCN